MGTMAQVVGDVGAPKAVHAEMTILGAILVEPTAFDEAAVTLEARDFYLDSHRRIYRTMTAMAAEGKAIDIVTVMNQLSDSRELDSVGGLPYLASLSEGLPRKLNIASYVRIVKGKSLSREIIKTCERTIAQAMEEKDEPEQVLAELQEETFAILAEDSSEKTATVADVVPRVVERVLRERDTDPNEVLGLRTGLQPLDYRLGGLREHEFTILSGESGDGKTALATQITIENALRGVPCAWFSLEMTKDQLTSRMFASLSYNQGEFGPRVTAAEMRDPRRIPKDRMNDFYRLGDKLVDLPILIDDEAGLELAKMMARARLMVRRHNVKLIVLDYVQLAYVNDPKLNDTQRLERVTYACRDLAKTEPVHVLALSQYSYEGRLKGSSSLRQSCQNLLKISREKVDEEYTGEAEVLIDKNREGSTGKVRCRYNNEYLRFHQ